MDTFETTLLGAVQGLTEFLPVSSSGHLALARIFLGVNEPSLSYDLVLHISTTLATLIYFSRDLCTLCCEWGYALFNRNARKWNGWRVGCGVIIGSFFTAPIGLLLKDTVENLSQNSLAVSIGLLMTSFLLISSKFIKERESCISASNAAIVGIVQGLAVFPGVSRSGSTIWAGLFLGLKKEEAFRFSFLLSIPAILGATLLQAKDVGGAAAFHASLPEGWLIGATLSFVFGYASLVMLKKLVTSSQWWLFGVYTFLLGSATLTMTLLNTGGW